MKTLSIPQPVGTQQLDSLQAAIKEIQAERARMEEFATELSQEWNLVRRDLEHCQTKLGEKRTALTDQERRLNRDRASLDSERAFARLTSDRLSELEDELQRSRQNSQDWESQRHHVRQHLSDVQEGFSSLSEIVELVQSTHAELHKAASSLQQRAAVLSHALDEMPDTPPAALPTAAAIDSPAAVKSGQLPAETDAATVDAMSHDIADALAEDMADDGDDESDADGNEISGDVDHRQECLVEDRSEEATGEEARPADPVVGSVLAELARFVKSETG